MLGRESDGDLLGISVGCDEGSKIGTAVGCTVGEIDG